MLSAHNHKYNGYTRIYAHKVVDAKLNYLDTCIWY